MLSNMDIRNIIPHRYPFLLVDKVIELEPGKRAVGIKNVTANEPFFQGHFPQYPLMPGVLILEALAQTAGIAVMAPADGSVPSAQESSGGKLGMFAGVEELKFKRQVIPGDTLRLEAEILVSKLGMIKAKGTATVDGQVAAEGIFKIMLADVKK